MTTKTALPTVALLILLAAPAHAQLAAIGAKGGLHWSDFNENFGPFDTDSRTTWGAGGFVRYAFGDGFSIQPELLWAGKGAKIDGGDILTTDVDLELSYVEIPVLLRYDFAPQRARFRPYVMAGPYIAFELTCEFDGEFDDVDDGIDVEIDCDNSLIGFYTNGTLAGLLGAIGVEVPLGDVADLLVEGRASRDFRDINETEINDSNDGLRNRVFGLYIGVSVPFGRR